MSPVLRVGLIIAAWVAPAAWVVTTALAGPSDGTVITSPSMVPGATDWGQAVTVVRTYGDTPLRAGDVVRTFDEVPLEQWIAAREAASWSRGDTVPVEVLRPAAGLDRIMVLEVRLDRYPLADAAARNAVPIVLAVVVLTVASVVFWRRPRDRAAAAFLVGAALLPGALTTHPFGIGAVDLGGGRGTWPHVAGGLLGCAGLAGVLVAVAEVGSARSGRAPWRGLALATVPFLGYATWLLMRLPRSSPEAARLQVTLAVLGPALAATVAVAFVVLVVSSLRAPDREGRLAARLVLLAAAGAIGLRVLLVDVPSLALDRPLVPAQLVSLLLIPAVLGCLAASLLGERVEELEVSVRRTLFRAAVAALVGAAFLGGALAVGLASDAPLEAMVTGGVVSLLVLPLALVLNRTVRRWIYGDREFPRRVVSDLRRLDPATSAGEVLEETLVLLARRLRLTHAAIVVFGQDGQEEVEVTIGAPRGHGTTVDLVAGGAVLGRLRLEVGPTRDPFGPGDRQLLEDVGAQVGALVQAVMVNRDLQQARQRLVAAREEERRRIRRDLHDGLGPSLATLALGLETARELIDRDPVRAAAMVARLAERTRDDIAEVRRLVDGLRPPALDQLGLVSALRQRADEHNAAAGAASGEGSMTWHLTAADDVEPLPAAVEVAAYRIVVEAVTNALRHSASTRCDVLLRREPDSLVVTVSDAGTGLPTTVEPGVGLGSMQQRAEELGGSYTLTSAPGVGTVVEVRLPLSGATEPEDARS